MGKHASSCSPVPAVISVPDWTFTGCGPWDQTHGVGAPARLERFQSAVIAIVRCPVPVLAVVQGTAAGFGFDLRSACDMRLAGSSATFTSAFSRIGLVPDGGSTFTLPRLVGVGRSPAHAHDQRDGRCQGSAHRSGWWRKSSTMPIWNPLVAAPSTRSSNRPARASGRIKRLARAPEIGALEQALSSEGAAQLQALQRPEFPHAAGGLCSADGCTRARGVTETAGILPARRAGRPGGAGHRRRNRDRLRDRLVSGSRRRRRGDREPQARPPRAGSRDSSGRVDRR